jgi:hypothetical protein
MPLLHALFAELELLLFSRLGPCCVSGLRFRLGFVTCTLMVAMVVTHLSAGDTNKAKSLQLRFFGMGCIASSARSRPLSPRASSQMLAVSRVPRYPPPHTHIPRTCRTVHSPVLVWRVDAPVSLNGLMEALFSGRRLARVQKRSWDFLQQLAMVSARTKAIIYTFLSPCCFALSALFTKRCDSRISSWQKVLMRCVLIRCITSPNPVSLIITPAFAGRCSTCVLHLRGQSCFRRD